MSEETKNPLIESFLKLHEAAASPFTAAASLNRPAKPEIIPQAKPIMPSVPMAGGGVNKPVGTGTSAFTNMPGAGTTSKPGTTGLGATSGEGYSERLKGIQKANPIATPGKLEGGNVLKVGSRGDDVKALQTKLGVTADGIFGPKTAAALKAKQGELGIKTDSVYGRQTKSALDRADAVSKLKSENPQGYKQYTGSSMAQNQITNSGVGSLRTGSSLGQNMITKSGPSSLKSAPTITSTSTEPRNAQDLVRANKPAENSTSSLPSAAQEYLAKKRMQQNNTTFDTAHYVPGLGDNMPSKIIEAFMKLQSKNPTNLFAEAKKAKKLDPVGKEDEDIDNDGDKDKTDSYLHNRRKKIAAAMKEERKDPYGEGIAKPGTKAPEMVPAKDKAPEVSKKGDLPKDVANRMAGERERDREIGEKGSRQRSMIDAAKDAANRGGGFRTPEAIAKGTGAMIAQPFVKAYDAVAGYEKPASKVIRNSPKSSIVMKNEEVEFSEAELEHLAAILEGPVAPTPAGYDVNAFGSSTSRSGTLTDEAIAEEEKKKRGRKPGVKVGAYGPRGAKKGEGEATTNVAVPHVFHQIRTSRADSQGNYNLQHEVGGKTLNAKVSARDAAEFSKKYMNTEKPREKEAHTDAFVAKHFGVSKPKSSGISLPKMPSPKS